MNWLYLVLFAVLALTMVCLNRSREGLDPIATVVGGTVASKMSFDYRPNSSTNVLQFLGNTRKNVILIHNTPFNMEVWRPLFSYSQQQINKGEKTPNLLAYDVLGHGTAWMPVEAQFNDSNINNYAWGYDTFIKDLYAIYKRYIKTGQITIVGYGSGGSIGQAFGLKYPDLVDELYVLGATIGPTQRGVTSDIPYLSQWIAKNPTVSYLTMDTAFVKWNMCVWFENNNPLTCPYLENKDDDKSTFDSVEYLLADKLFRTASSSTYLQLNKLLNAVDLTEQWKDASVLFPVTFLVASDDHYINLTTLQNNLSIVQNATPAAKLYIVDGKHGFPLIFSGYIFDLMTDKDLSKNTLTTQVV